MASLESSRLLRKVIDGARQCTSCRRVLPVADFYRHSQRPRTTHSACKACTNARSTALRKLNPSRSRDAVRRSHMKAKYGLTWAAFEALIAQQGGGCAICRVELDVARRDKSVHVDHDHGTGAVRGVLCGKCNPGLGQFQDSPELLERAAAYLRARKGLKVAA